MSTDAGRKWYCSAIVKSTIGALVLISAALYLVHIWVPKFYGYPDGPGVYGDMFGVANALFSGLALAGVVLAIVLQSKELALQRQELEATREEIKGQREQLTLQQQTMKQQQYESTFFHHLELLSSIVSAMVQKSAIEKVTATGHDCFNSWLNDLLTYYFKPKYHVNMPKTLPGIVVTGYDYFYQDYNMEVGHYFRTLYNTIKYVHESELENKLTYISLVRAQLSNSQVVILLFNCMHPVGVEIKPLVEEYALLKYFPQEIEGFGDEDLAILRKEFDPRAFGRKQ